MNLSEIHRLYFAQVTNVLHMLASDSLLKTKFQSAGTEVAVHLIVKIALLSYLGLPFF